ncbi:aspartate aminotransferase family protein [Spirillospora sp. NPDC127200]
MSGKGNRLTGADGRTYLDFYSGVATSILGHGVPEIWEAVERQMGTGVVHLSPFYADRTRVELAERITALSGIGDAQVVFTLSGSEAVDLALLLATLYRRSDQLLALRHGFYGTTFGAMAVTGDRRWVGMGLSPFQVSHVRGGYDRYHGIWREMDDAAYVRQAVQELTEVMDTGTADRVAAMIVEPVQGVAGAAAPPPGLLRAYQDVLRRDGVLLISDEVQTGWGRTGKHLWGYRHHDVVPDLLVFGKGLGGGFPIGGVVARKEIMQAFGGMRMSALSGDPLSVAAAAATLGYILDHDLPSHADAVGRMLREEMRAAIGASPIVADVRGQGLLLSVEFARPGTGAAASGIAERVQEECRGRGLLVGLGGAHEHCVSLLPPLTLSRAEAQEGLEKIVSAVRTVERQGT